MRIQPLYPVILLTCWTTLAAQEFDELSIFGFVTDQATGARVAGVVVEATNQADTTQRKLAVSDATGRYIIDLITDVRPIAGVTPSDFGLEQNYPNPFNPSTRIQFRIPTLSRVQLVLYNTLGQQVKNLIDATLSPGTYSAVWDATNDALVGVAAGVYFYQLRTENFVQTKKMLLLDGSLGGEIGALPGSTLQNSQESLAKLSELMITMRATGPRIMGYEERNILVSTQNFRFDIPVVVTTESVIDTDRIIISEPDATEKVYVSGLVDALIDTVVGTEKITVRNMRTGEETFMRADNDGSFATIVLQGMVGDALVMAVLSKDQKVGEGEVLNVPDKKSPVIVSTKPTNGDKDVLLDRRVFVSFSEPIEQSTLNDNTFSLSSEAGEVDGTFNFLNNSTVIIFTPDQPLAPLTNYTVSVTTEVTDLQGDSLKADFTSRFETGGLIATDTRIALFQMIGATRNGQLLGSIHSMKPDGSARVALTKRTDVEDLFPEYSPDGSRIIFSRIVRLPFEDSFDIYIMNADGTYLENLTNTPDFDETAPSFSPDGQRIAYTSNSDGNPELYVMDVNGRNQIRLTDHPDYDFGPDWSPDGSVIAFSSERDGKADIFLMSPDGTSLVNLTSSMEGPFDRPFWSPDGRQIAFFDNLQGQVLLMDADGSNVTFLTTGSSGQAKIGWSPDGQRLVIPDIDYSEEGGFGIAVINRDGSNRHWITPLSWEFFVLTPDWSPQ